MQVKALLILAILPLFFITAYAESHEEREIPVWIVNTVTWWLEETVDDHSLFVAIEYLIENNFIEADLEDIPITFSDDFIVGSQSWIDDQITDDEWLQVISNWILELTPVEPEPPVEPDPIIVPEPVITLDELYLMIINNTDMMHGMYADMETIKEQNTQFYLSITSLTDTITSLTDTITSLTDTTTVLETQLTAIKLSLEDREIPIPQTIPIINNFVYSADNGTVDLSWDVVSGDPIVKYMFKWRDTPGTAWSKDIVRVETLTSWQITGLENVEYEFAFFATNDVGVSETEYFTLTP